MTVYFSGYVFQDDGDALSGATVQLLQVSDGAEEASTTTDSNGLWAFNEADDDRYDVKITSGTSVRYRKWADEISLKTLDVRNNEGNTVGAASFTNLTNNASNQVATFSGANSTRADGDEIYLSFKLANSAGDLEEFARITTEANDVTDGEEAGEIRFSVMKSGTLTDVWTLDSSTTGSVSMDINADSLTLGAAGDTDITLTFDANTGDGVITWMEDEDYFKFSDEILMNGTEKLLFGDTGTFIHQSSDGVLTIESDTTVDINGAVVFNGALSGISTIGASGVVTAGGFTIGSAAIVEAELETIDGVTAGTAAASKAVVLDGSKNIATIGTIGSGAITSTGTSSFGSGTTIGNLTLANGSITDSGGALDFGDETLTTTGAVDFGAATVDSLSVSDANITNVADIALDSISADGTDINVAVSDNSATALTIKQGSDAYLIVDTANSSESVAIGTGISGTAISIGHSTSETTINDNLTVTGTLTGTLATAAQANVTSLGTLTTLTVDNVIVNGTTIGHTSDTDLLTLTSGNLTIAGTTTLGGHLLTGGDRSIYGSSATSAGGGARLRMLPNSSSTPFIFYTQDNDDDADVIRLKLPGGAATTGTVAWENINVMTIDQAATIQTTTGALTIDGDDGIVLNTGGSGGVQVNEELTVGVNDTGYDVKFFGATSGNICCGMRVRTHFKSKENSQQSVEVKYPML